MAKWHKVKPSYRQKDVDRPLRVPPLCRSIFVSCFRETKACQDLTAHATAKSIHAKAQRAPYEVTIFADGRRKPELPVFTRGLRALQIVIRKVWGVKKEENNAYVRLADAMCGVSRDAKEENPWRR